MLQLNLKSIAEPAWAAVANVPKFDIAAARDETARNPVWIHFGAGNIFRAFIARIQQRLLEEGLQSAGIVAVDTSRSGAAQQISAAHDHLALSVGLRPDGTTEYNVVASVADCLRPAEEADRAKLEEMFCAPSLQMVSLTITEKGYALRSMDGVLLPAIAEDIEKGPEKCAQSVSLLTALLWKRFCAGASPIAAVSMDNCSKNGEKLSAAVTEIAKAWAERGFVGNDFVLWLGKEMRFPWSMIDKITPAPSQKVSEALNAAGIGGMERIDNGRGVMTAAFVNAEIPEYLVVEDDFSSGRPPLERAGVYMTDRVTVNRVERMKVTACLNPLHTALAIFGCLLGYTSIAAEMRDPALKRMVERLGRQEALPVVAHPGILDPQAFLDECVNVRFPNPFMPDTPQRIATDTSQKIPVRYGETIKSYLAKGDDSLKNLTMIPLAIAGWLRMLTGVGDDGKPMVISADPMLSDLQAKLAGMKVGEPESCRGRAENVLCNEKLFGADLVACGMADKIVVMLSEMLEGAGAVRRTLEKYVFAE